MFIAVLIVGDKHIAAPQILAPQLMTDKPMLCWKRFDS